MARPHYRAAAFEALALYLLTGAACILVGSSMTHLMDHFGVSLAQVAAIQSAYALGRMSTVFLTGWITERFGVRTSLLLGTALLLAFLGGIPLTHNYFVGLALAFLGGAGMGSQDAACPVILSAVYPHSYASMLSAGQALFGAGCFLPPLIMSVALAVDLPFYVSYYVFAALALVMLLVLPFMKLPEMSHLATDGGHTAHAIRLRVRWLGIVLFAVICFAYSAVVNTINLYTATFAEGLALPAALSANLLTVYNLASMAGSLCFTTVLRRVAPIRVLIGNCVIALVALALAVWLQQPAVFFLGLAVAGFFLGVLFSVIVTLATGLKPSHASLAAAAVAVVSGGSDTVNPLITGPLFTALGMGMAYPYTMLVLALTLAASLGFAALARPAHPSETA